MTSPTFKRTTDLLYGESKQGTQQGIERPQSPNYQRTTNLLEFNEKAEIPQHKNLSKAG